MNDEQVYKEIFTTIIKGKKVSFGQMALDITKQVEGLEVDIDGNVTTLNGNPKDLLHDLLLRYEVVAGRTSTLTAKASVISIILKNPGIELPEEFK